MAQNIATMTPIETFVPYARRYCGHLGFVDECSGEFSEAVPFK